MILINQILKLRGKIYEEDNQIYYNYNFAYINNNNNYKHIHNYNNKTNDKKY